MSTPHSNLCNSKTITAGTNLLLVPIMPTQAAPHNRAKMERLLLLSQLFPQETIYQVCLDIPDPNNNA